MEKVYGTSHNTVMPGKDPDHWLYRLTADEWLRAAAYELRRAERALVAKQQRAGVAGARRAAGMAVNGILAALVEPDPSYGRSYMDHLTALRDDISTHDTVRAAAEALLEAPMQTDLVQVGPGDTRLATCAFEILEYARLCLRPSSTA
jgi:HEPN domain-containing protein